MIDKVKQGRRNRAKGRVFEERVRKELEANGWTVTKCQIQVDLEADKIVPSRGSRFRSTRNGFPDFIAFRLMKDDPTRPQSYNVIGVECKGGDNPSSLYLDKTERERAQWYLDKQIFNQFFVAVKRKEKNRVKIEYKEV